MRTHDGQSTQVSRTLLSIYYLVYVLSVFYGWTVGPIVSWKIDQLRLFDTTRRAPRSRNALIFGPLFLLFLR
jgi:hypothetical protein